MEGITSIAVLPIAKVFTVCFAGFLMASKRFDVLSPDARKLLNRLVFTLLLPCVIFSQLGPAITLEKMKEWWFIPANVLLGTITGSIIGLIIAVLVHPPHPFFKFTVVQIGIGNISNLPLVLISALCRDKSNPFGDSNTCATSGAAYLSFGQWVGAVVLYTYVFHMLAPPPESGYFDIENGYSYYHPIKASINERTGRNLLLPWLTGNVETSTDSNVWTRMRNFFVFLFKKLSKLAKQILQPPIVASILAMVFGTIPFLKRLIFTSDAPLFFITDGCVILGQAMIPCILLALGGSLVDGAASSKLGVRTTAAIVFARLVLVPPVGLGIVILADKLGFLPAGDKMFRFVLLLQHTMPTSVMAGAMANLRGYGKEVASVLFWVHIFAIFSMTVWIAIYLNILL